MWNELRDPQQWILPGLGAAIVIVVAIAQGADFFTAVNGVIVGVFWGVVLMAAIVGGVLGVAELIRAIGKRITRR